MARARALGSALLKMPEPTKTASAPSARHSAASAGVAMPPAAKFGTGRRPCCATKRTRSSGACSSLARAGSSSGAVVVRRRISPHTLRRCRTASTMLPLPASPLVRIIAAPSAIRRSASPRFRAPHTNGRLEVVLPDVVLVVGGRQHLGLVDEVDAERLEHARLEQVADAHLRHHRNRDGLLDLLDHLDRAHARDAAFLADVGRNALERHHRAGAGVLGDLRLLGVRDVHDHAALQHLREPDLELERLRSSALRAAAVVSVLGGHGISSCSIRF